MKLLKKIINKASYFSILMTFIMVFSGTVYGQTGFFESLGISSTKGSRTSYKKTKEVIKPSSNASTRLSDKSVELTGKTGKATYNDSVKPSIEYSLDISDKSIDFTKNSSEKSVDFSWENSTEPGFKLAGKGSTYLTELSDKSLEFTESSVEYSIELSNDYVIPTVKSGSMALSAVTRKSVNSSRYINFYYISGGNVIAVSKASINLSHRTFQASCYDILYPSFNNSMDISSISSGLFIAGYLYFQDEIAVPSFAVSFDLSTGISGVSKNYYNQLINESLLGMIDAGVDLLSAAFGISVYSSGYMYEEMVDTLKFVTDFASLIAGVVSNVTRFVVQESFVDIAKVTIDFSSVVAGVSLNSSVFIYEESMVDSVKFAVDAAAFAGGVSLRGSQISVEEVVDLSKDAVDMASVSMGGTYNTSKFIVNESFIPAAKFTSDLSSFSIGITGNSSGIIYDESIAFSKFSYDISAFTGGAIAKGSVFIMEEFFYPSIKLSIDTAYVSGALLENISKSVVYEIVIPMIDNTMDLTAYLVTISEYAFIFVFETFVVNPVKYVVENTIEISDQSTGFTGDFTKNTTINTAKITGEKIEITSKETTKGTDKSYDVSVNQTQKISDSSSEFSGKSSKNSLNISRKTDVSTAQTSEKTSFWRSPKKVSAITGDRLINDSYAGKGSTLSFFAQKLNLKEEVLAKIVKEKVPESPTVDELENVLKYVFEGIKA